MNQVQQGSPPAISVQNLSKKFKFWNERSASFKSLLVDAITGKLNLGKFQEFQVLDNVAFDIFPGEFVGIMGANGAGKSTLLKLICNIYQPTSGSVTVRGQIAPLIELGAGFSEDLSGYENIFLNASILGFGRKATQEALPKIIAFAEIGEKIHMPVKKYSSGMLVRLGFSIAAHLAAPVMLIDEVLAVGDAGFQQKCLKKIDELHREGRTIVLITHDPEAVKRHATRCIVVSETKKVYDGEVEQGVQMYLSICQNKSSPLSDV